MGRSCTTGLLFLVGAAALVARVVEGYAWCKEYWNWDGKQNWHSGKDGRRWPANDGVVITYINGIFHSVPEWESITHQLQAIFGHEVRPFYNPSSGWWITDASKAGYHLLRKPANDTIAQALGDHLAQAVEDVGKGRVLHIAHSGGALITYLAAQHHLTKRQRDKIDVLTFGGARSITRKYFSGRVVNYYARNDPLAKLDRRAAELMKLTNNTKYQEINEKHNTTFIFLEGRARQFVLDHSLEGPTYQHALRKEAKAFRRAHFGPLSPLSWDYEQSLLRLARKKAAQLSGLHNFFDTERFGLRSLRKSIAHLTGLHGFFSGKNPSSKGVAVSVVGNGKKNRAGAGAGAGAAAAAAAVADEGEVAAKARWWWPWGRRTGGSSGSSSGGGEIDVVPDETAPGGDDDKVQFFIGFRWSRRRKDSQDQEEQGQEGLEEVADLVAPPPLLMDDEVEGAAGDEEGFVPRRSRWALVRNAYSWGFSRKEKEKEEATAGDEAAANVLEAPRDVNGDEAKSKGGSGEEEGQDHLNSASEGQSSSRPWLSVGWTPWRGRAVAAGGGSEDSSASEGDGGVGAEAGLPSAVAVEEGSTEDGGVAEAGGGGGKASADVVEGEGEGEVVGTGDGGSGDGGSPPLVTTPSSTGAEVSYLRRWWPSSGRGSGTGGTQEATGGAAGGADGGEDSVEGKGGGNVDSDGSVGGGDGDGSVKEGEEGGERGGDGMGGEGEPRPGETGQLVEKPETVSELSEEEQERSASLLRRWWPSSKQLSTTSASTTTTNTSTIPPEASHGLNANDPQLEVGGINVAEAVVTGPGSGSGGGGGGDDDDGGRDERLENEDLGGGGGGDEDAEELQVLNGPTAQQQEQGKKEDRAEEGGEERGGLSVHSTRPGVRVELSAGEAATTFAQRFWEIFSNKPAEPVSPVESTSPAPNVRESSSEAAAMIEAAAEGLETGGPEEGGTGAAVVGRAGTGNGGQGEGQDEAESLVGEVIVAEDFLRPAAAADHDHDNPPKLPPQPDTESPEIEDLFVGGGEGGGEGAGEGGGEGAGERAGGDGADGQEAGEEVGEEVDQPRELRSSDGGGGVDVLEEGEEGDEQPTQKRVNNGEVLDSEKGEGAQEHDPDPDPVARLEKVEDSDPAPVKANASAKAEEEGVLDGSSSGHDRRQ